MCHCSRLLYCIGNISYIFERLASCCALTAVVSCLIVTLIIMLALGIGLGYNYCYVDNMSGRDKEHVDQLAREDVNVVEITKKPPVPTIQRRDMDIQPTMRVPLNENIDIPLLIKRIKATKQNVTLFLTP